ncbi:hypothetical protein E2320_001265, partial [Naja naja]
MFRTFKKKEDGSSLGEKVEKLACATLPKNNFAPKIEKEILHFQRRICFCKRMEKFLFLSKENLNGTNRFAGQTIAGNWRLDILSWSQHVYYEALLERFCFLIFSMIPWPVALLKTHTQHPSNETRDSTVPVSGVDFGLLNPQGCLPTMVLKFIQKELADLPLFVWIFLTIMSGGKITTIE